MVFPAHRRQIGFVCTTSPPIAAAGRRGRIGFVSHNPSSQIGFVSHNRSDHWLRLCAGRGSGTRGRLLVGWASPPDFFCPPADRQIGFVSHGRSTGASHFKHQPSHFRLLLFICLPLLPAVLHETCRKNGLRHPPKSPQVLVLTPVKKSWYRPVFGSGLLHKRERHRGFPGAGTATEFRPHPEKSQKYGRARYR